MPVIFQICDAVNIGSTGTIAEALGTLAIQRGWKSYIAYGRLSRPSKSQLIRIGTNLDVLTHGLITRLFDRHCLGSTRATRTIVNQIKKIKPDIIHLHHLHGYYINIEILFEFLSKESIPVVWTLHDCWSITGHCTNFDFVGCKKWRTECSHCPQKNEYPASFFVDRSKQNFLLKKKLFTSVSNMTVVSVSKWLNNIVHNSFMAGMPSQIIYNGIDVDLFTPIAKNSNFRKDFKRKDCFMILGVASPWGKRKGLIDFIKLSKKLDDNDLIVLVGLSVTQIKKLPSNVIGIKRIDNQEELQNLFVIADVFLNLSVEETFGLTTAEALSCGTPAIVYNTTACPEVVDSTTGLVVEKNDIDSLLEAINTVKKQGKKFYSSTCRERALKNFNKNNQFSEYIDLYERLIKTQSLNKKSVISAYTLPD